MLLRPKVAEICRASRPGRKLTRAAVLSLVLSTTCNLAFYQPLRVVWVGDPEPELKDVFLCCGASSFMQAESTDSLLADLNQTNVIVLKSDEGAPPGFLLVWVKDFARINPRQSTRVHAFVRERPSQAVVPNLSKELVHVPRPDDQSEVQESPEDPL